MENVIDRLKRLGADRKRADFKVKQNQPYEFKKKYAATRAREFCGQKGEM